LVAITVALVVTCFDSNNVIFVIAKSSQ